MRVGLAGTGDRPKRLRYAELNGASIPFLVTEYAKRGSLRCNLDRDVTLAPARQFSWHTLVGFALDTASGMAYLHSKGIVHRDLKPDNLLVFESPPRHPAPPLSANGLQVRRAPTNHHVLESKWFVKVTDFGTARVIGMHSKAKVPKATAVAVAAAAAIPATAPTAATAGGGGGDGKGDVKLLLPAQSQPVYEDDAWCQVEGNANLTSYDMGTPEYMAPELHCRERIGPEVDIFAYGITLWEIVTRDRPFRGGSSVRAGPGEIRRRVVQELDGPGYRMGRPTPPDYASAQYTLWIERCWHTAWGDRPTFQQLKRGMQEIQRQLADSTDNRQLWGVRVAAAGPPDNIDLAKSSGSFVGPTPVAATYPGTGWSTHIN